MVVGTVDQIVGEAGGTYPADKLGNFERYLQTLELSAEYYRVGTVTFRNISYFYNVRTEK